ncbi:hypothetical protein CHARACLAT_005420 [Characodon lateralis]|uniref:Uncharacterized protein n=1 Tax=Characodon lateralis TaxID=208331 RepID=A0ABU7E789_9TELE|nr:hypothetical protein [Characodon lateralis]
MPVILFQCKEVKEHIFPLWLVQNNPWQTAPFQEVGYEMSETTKLQNSKKHEAKAGGRLAWQSTMIVNDPREKKPCTRTRCLSLIRDRVVEVAVSVETPRLHSPQTPHPALLGGA